MKNKTVILIFSIITFVSICFTACENQIINKWWVDKTEPEEPEYIPLLKIAPISYDTVFEDKIIYEKVFVQLPPQTIYETVYVDKPVYQIIYEQLPPEVIYQTVEVIKEVPEYITVYQDVIKYIPPDENTIIEWLKDPANTDKVNEIVEKIKELYPDAFIEYVDVPVPPEIIYQEVIKTEYVTVYQDVIKYIPPDKDTIIQWLKDPENADDTKKIIEEIKELIPVDVIKEIIKQIPPKDIIEYLTEEQIQYIINQQPPQKILQSIRIIDIEYILFAGDSSVYNGLPPQSANTPLSSQQKTFNASNIKNMAQLLSDNPTYILMLHGHANPVTNTDAEKGDLMKLSKDRADAVKQVLKAEYNKLPVNPANIDFENRVSTSGYGGEKILAGSDPSDTALNRRVEMILFAIDTIVE